MDTTYYQEEIERLKNLLTTEKRERRQEKDIFFETIKKMARASQVVSKAFEDEQKSHDETKKIYEQTAEKLKAEKDCLIVSLQERITTEEAKVLAAEKLANDYKQKFIEEKNAHLEMRRSYCETVNSLIEKNDCLKVALSELSESNQTSDLSAKQVGEIFQSGLEKAKSSELEPRDLIIRNLRSQNKALCVQIQQSTSDFRKCLDETRKAVMRDLQDLKTFCLGVEEQYQSGVTSYKQQVEYLQQELEKEKASHADTWKTKQNIILSIQAEKEALCLHMIQAADEMERLFGDEKRSFLKHLEEKDLLYQKLQDKYEAELSDIKQLMGNLNQELQEEIRAREEREDIIFTIQAQKEELCLQMQQQTSEFNKLYEETKRNFINELEQRDVSNQIRELKYKTELSESHQAIENVQQQLDRERKDHLDDREKKQNIILTIQAEKEAFCLQMIQAADEMERLFGDEKRQFEKNLEQKDVLFQSLKDKYEAELSESRQQLGHLHRKLEEEMKLRKEKEEMIFIVQDEKVELYNEMAEKARALERQFEIEKRNFLKDLEEKDVSYHDLQLKYKTELSESHQAIENVQQQLDRERKDHLDTQQEKQNIILTIQAEKEAFCLQMIQAADEMERLFGDEKRQFEKNLEQKDVSYEILHSKYEAELSESRQQVEHLHRKLEKETKLRKEKEEMIFIVQDEKVELYNEMAEKARALERQFEIEKRNFMKDLEEKDVSYHDLQLKYKTEVFNGKRQIESLQQEMEKEREEAAKTILTIQSKKEQLSLQMVQTAASVEEQFEVEKSKFQKDLDERDALYRDLRLKYMDLFFLTATSC